MAKKEEAMRITTSEGKIVEVVEVEVVSADEHWNIYQLADGHELAFKDVLTSVVKAKDTPEGAVPQYYFYTQRIPKVR